MAQHDSMHDTAPKTRHAPEYSDDNTQATPWSAGREVLQKAEMYWLSTIRPEGRPHVTPLIGVWLDDDQDAQSGALYFCTGTEERKARNLAHNTQCILTTGRNTMQPGLDVVVEGEAVPVTDAATLQRLAEAYLAKYGPTWTFAVQDGMFKGEAGNLAQVFEVRPVTAFGFGKAPFSQTRWQF